MQDSSPVWLSIGTHVSAKYKGAFCEARVRSVQKVVKVRVTFKQGLGSSTLSDELVQCDADNALTVGAAVRARHPDTHEYVSAVVNKIQDQSLYTVVFDDGDITTLKRNALCIKSGKHFNASESLDNLPLTHPEHFSSPVASMGNDAFVGVLSGPNSNTSSPKPPSSPIDGSVVLNAAGRRRRRVGSNARGDATEDKGDASSAANENENDSDGSSDEVGMAGAPYVASIGRVVWAENTDKKSSRRETWFPALIVTPSAASGYVKIDVRDDFLIRSFKDGRYYTVSKKETHVFQRDSFKREENAPVKDAMERALAYLDGGILPAHWDRDALFDVSSLTRTEEESTGGSTESSSEEDQLDYKLDDFELEESNETKDRLVAELYKHMEEKGAPINRTPVIANREVDLCLLFRLVTRLGGHARVSSKSLWRLVTQKLGFDNTAWSTNQVRVTYKRYLQSFEESREETVAPEKSESVQSKEESNLVPDKSDENSENVIGSRVATRPRRDSTSSLAAAIQARAQKDAIGDDQNSNVVMGNRKPVVRVDRDKDVEGELVRLQTNNSLATTSPATSSASTTAHDNATLVEQSTKPNKTNPTEKRSKKLAKRKDKEPEDDEAADQEDTGKQHLEPDVRVESGDRIKVFYKFDIIYEAKVLRVKERPYLSTNKFLVHYLGWNARYDEWIHRSRISENLSWTKERAMAANPSGDKFLDKSVQQKISEEGSQVQKDKSGELKKTLRANKNQNESAHCATPPPSRSTSQRRGSPAPTSSMTSLKRQNSRASSKGSEEITDEEPQPRSQRSTRLSKLESAPLSRRVSGRKRASQNSKEQEEAAPVVKKQAKVTTKRGLSNSSSSSSSSVTTTPATSTTSGRRVTAGKTKGMFSTDESGSGSDEKEAATKPSPTSTKRSSRNCSKANSKPPVADDVDPYAFKEPETEVTSEEPEVSKASSKKTVSNQVSSAPACSTRRGSTISTTTSAPTDTTPTSSSSTSGTTVTSEAMSLRRSMKSPSPQRNEVKKETLTETKMTVTTTTATSTTVEKVTSKASINEGAKKTTLVTTKTMSTVTTTSSPPISASVTVSSRVAETKHVLQLTKTQQELFPYLSATINMSAGDVTIKEETEDSKEPSIETKGLDNVSTQPSSELKPSGSIRGKRQRKTPRKPNSSELVESDSDSEEQEAVRQEDTKKSTKTKDEPLVKDNELKPSSREDQLDDNEMDEEEDEEDSSKANTESSDLEVESKNKRATSIPTSLTSMTITSTSSSVTTTARKVARKRAPTALSPPKRKRRTREAVLKAAAAAAHYQREESAMEMARIAEKVGDLANLDDEALKALTRGPAKKYNFFVHPKPGVGATERIALIEKSIEDLRQTYLSVKGELAMVERRRKRMRWRAKERLAEENKKNQDTEAKPETKEDDSGVKVVKEDFDEQAK